MYTIPGCSWDKVCCPGFLRDWCVLPGILKILGQRCLAVNCIPSSCILCKPSQDVLGTDVCCPGLLRYSDRGCMPSWDVVCVYLQLLRTRALGCMRLISNGCFNLGNLKIYGQVGVSGQPPRTRWLFVNKENTSFSIVNWL